MLMIGVKSVIGSYGDLGVDGRIGGRGRDRGHAQLVAVGRGARGFGRADDAAAAGLVDHHHALAQRLGQRLGDHARHDVGGAARRERHLQLDRLVRIALGERGPGARERAQRQAAPAHGIPVATLHASATLHPVSRVEVETSMLADSRMPAVPWIPEGHARGRLILERVNFAQLLFPDFSLIACGWSPVPLHRPQPHGVGPGRKPGLLLPVPGAACSIRSCAARSISAPPPACSTAGLLTVSLAGIALAYSLPPALAAGSRTTSTGATTRPARRSRFASTPSSPGAGRTAGRRAGPAADRGADRRVRAAVQRGRGVADGAPRAHRLPAPAGCATRSIIATASRPAGQPAGLHRPDLAGRPRCRASAAPRWRWA